MHKTENPEVFDGYYGNGIYNGYDIKYPKTAFAHAIKKYGFKSFVRSTLFIFNSENEAYEMEKTIVNEDFIKLHTNYNSITGGKSGGGKYKRLFQYTLQGTFVKEWTSVSEAYEFFKCNPQRFLMAIEGKYDAFNSFWSFNKHDVLDTSKYRTNKFSTIYQFDLKGNMINEWKSVKQISEALKLSKDSIINAMHTKRPLLQSYFSKNSDIKEWFKNDNLTQTRRYISQYDENKDIVKTYSSITLLSHELEVSVVEINKAIKNKIQLKGFYFKRGITQKFDEAPIPKTKKIAQYDLQGGLIKIWDTVSECSKLFPKCTAVAKGIRKTTGGYVFKYI